MPRTHPPKRLLPWPQRQYSDPITATLGIRLCRREVLLEKVPELLIVKQKREVRKVILKSCTPLKNTFSPQVGDGENTTWLRKQGLCYCSFPRWGLGVGCVCWRGTAQHRGKLLEVRLSAKWNHPEGRQAFPSEGSRSPGTACLALKT